MSSLHNLGTSGVTKQALLSDIASLSWVCNIQGPQARIAAEAAEQAPPAQATLELEDGG